jgi:hypothetical protein
MWLTVWKNVPGLQQDVGENYEHSPQKKNRLRPRCNVIFQSSLNSYISYVSEVTASSQASASSLSWLTWIRCYIRHGEIRPNWKVTTTRIWCSKPKDPSENCVQKSADVQLWLWRGLMAMPINKWRTALNVFAEKWATKRITTRE